jgi:hypothetical protein
MLVKLVKLSWLPLPCIAGAEEWMVLPFLSNWKLGITSLLQSHPEVAGQMEQLRSDRATLLIFHHDDWEDRTAMFAECNYTWGSF